MNEWITTDLDGTLFSRAHSQGAIAATWRDSDGAREPSSWIPATRHTLLSRLAAHFAVVAVTARDLASYSRVHVERLPFNSGAVVANGAILLRPGDMKPDPDWDAEIAPQLAAWEEPLAEMAARIEKLSVGRVRSRLVASNTAHPAYLVAKAEDGFWSTSEGCELRAALSPLGCRIAEIGRELQVLPPVVSKQIGVAALQNRYFNGNPPLLAFGDMPEDLGFLAGAVFMAAPADSTLGKRWRNGS